MSGKRGNNLEKYTEEKFNERENNSMGNKSEVEDMLKEKIVRRKKAL